MEGTSSLGAGTSGVLCGGTSARKQALALHALMVHIHAVWGPCARLPGQGLGLGLVSLQVQCSQQEEAATQGDDEGAAQETLLEAEEALQVGVRMPRPQGTGDPALQVQ